MSVGDRHEGVPQGDEPIVGEAKTSDDADRDWR
jgi:hypothetical protein